MPAVPQIATSLHGGCGCGAIRYAITMPEPASRPILYEGAGEKGRLPLSSLDHCNDCRRATGGIVNAWLLCPFSYVEYSLLKQSSGGGVNATANGSSSTQRVQVGTREVCRPGAKSEGTYLQYYMSHLKEEVARLFCGRCGTCVGYSYYPSPEGMADVVDILIGTLDREDLERVSVDRHIWWDCGVDWIQRLVTTGNVAAGEEGGLPRHPDLDLDVTTTKYAKEGQS